MGGMINIYTTLVVKPAGKSPLDAPQFRGENSIKMGQEETGCYDVKWIHLAQWRDQWRAILNTVTYI
jgi:hypothetical protein